MYRSSSYSDDSIPPFPPTRTGLVHLECTTEGFKVSGQKDIETDTRKQR